MSQLRQKYPFLVPCHFPLKVKNFGANLLSVLQHSSFQPFISWLSFVFSRVRNLNCPDQKIAFWTDYVTDISKEAEYGYNLDASSVFYPWVKHRMADITNYRSHSFTNLFTGKKSPVAQTPFMQEFDDSVQHFVNPEQQNGAISQDDNQLIGFGS